MPTADPKNLTEELTQAKHDMLKAEYQRVYMAFARCQADLKYSEKMIPTLEDTDEGKMHKEELEANKKTAQEDLKRYGTQLENIKELLEDLRK